MSWKLLTVFSLALFISGRTSANELDLRYEKIVLDAMAVQNAVWVLTYGDNNPEIEVYETKMSQLLDELSKQNTGFRKDSYPIELKIDSGNKTRVEEICSALDKTRLEVKELTKIAINQFEVNRLPTLMTLISDNPGDYYTGYNPNFKFGLHNHPLRANIEELQLQDIGFEAEMASGDSSLWNMGRHCPNLRSVVLFGAELESSALARLNLHTIKRLKSLELSENRIQTLPSDFNQNNTLEYLSLRQNQISRLPEIFKSWTNLKFLDLRNNPLSEEEKDRIKLVLTHTKISF